MASFPQVDLTAQLSAFLLSGYVATFYDPRHTMEERLQCRMDLESFLLSHGPNALKEVQRAFNIQDQEVTGLAHVADWFISFVSSMNEEWLRVVNLSVIESFWKRLKDDRVRRAAIDLIAKVETANEPTGNTAYGSLLVSLFRAKQADPFASELSPESHLIISSLLDRIRLTPPPVFASPQGTLARYSLGVLRFCFKDRFERFSPLEIDYIVRLAGDIDEFVEERLRSLELA